MLERWYAGVSMSASASQHITIGFAHPFASGRKCHEMKPARARMTGGRSLWRLCYFRLANLSRAQRHRLAPITRIKARNQGKRANGASG